MKLSKHVQPIVVAMLWASCMYAQSFTVDLKVFLEGPYSGSHMSTALNTGNYLPLAQPYNCAPWNYQGTEGVGAIPNPDVVDWVLAELRETAGDASMAYEECAIARQAGFLLSDGHIVTLDGISPLQFNYPVSAKLYAVVYHRNHLAVLSGSELVNTTGNYSYDYTTGAGQAYGGSNAHKEIASGIWGMVSGDGDANGQVNNSDKNDVWKPQSGNAGYQPGDFSMNGQVDNVDKNDYWKPNSGKSTQVVGAWSCGKPIADSRDSQSYSTVQIGTQCWMRENMNIGILIPGTSLQSDNGVIEKYCYDDSNADCDVYGGLYQWNEMMQYGTAPGSKGICPDGWHLPADAEYCTLTQFVDPTVDCGVTGQSGTDVGTKMKSTSGWYGGGNGTNVSGFTALPGGFRSSGGNFYDLTYGALFWSSSASSGSSAWIRDLTFDFASIDRTNGSTGAGISVRCVKDLNLPPSQPSNPNPPDSSAGQPVNAQLSWTCSDPEADPLTYDVFFGTANPPTQVSSGQTQTTYDPGALNHSTTYYWKILAHDDHGNGTPGPVWSFATEWQCGGTFVDPRDNQEYSTVQIGTQCWMAENMNTGVMIPGAGNQTDNGLIEKYCYNDTEANCDVYGGLYQWNEMMQYVSLAFSQGICPDGWHLPTDGEWCTLEQFVDPTINCMITGWRGIDGGGKLKEAGTAHWAPPNTGATNSSGFTALPEGVRLENGVFGSLTLYGHQWSSSGNANNGLARGLSTYYATVNRYYATKIYGMGVRCLKNPPNDPPAEPSSPDPPDNATNQIILTQLSWTCTDPENDPLTYDVFFGTVNPPVEVATGLTATTWDPGLLNHGTTHYWKIVAHDDHYNTTEGPVWSFTTGQGWQCNEPFTDPRDNQEYPSVQIDTQCWMAGNLNIGTMIPGAGNQTDNGLMEKYCYGNTEANCDVYGGLYQWDEMMQYVTTPGVKGICPDDWHLPTDAEYCTVTHFIDPTVDCNATMWSGTDIAIKMKSASGWYGGGNGNNASGFTALPAGSRSDNGSFYDLTYTAIFWTSTDGGIPAWNRYMYYLYDNIMRDNLIKTLGMSVRCVYNGPNQPPDQPSDPDPPDNAVNRPLDTQLSWTCTDPENDPLTYDVYFDITTPPQKVAVGLTAPSYDPGPLNPNTTYYWQILAHDDHGNDNLGPQWSFVTAWACGEDFIDPRDNQAYQTVQIGTQCWMAENLNTGSMITGATSQTNNGVIEKHCYDDNTANCDTYGGLYQWDEMMQYLTIPGIQGVCPGGWRLPTDAEYCTLTLFLDPTVDCGEVGFSGTDVGTKMKATAGWSGGGNGTNTSGFTALPGGYRSSGGTFGGLTQGGIFWSSSENSSAGWGRNLFYNHADIARGTKAKEYSQSVRCLRDDPPPTWDCGDDLFDARDGQTYATVQIGTQCWMQENLNAGTMITGTHDQSDNGILEKYCYADDPANCDAYGGLYQWYEVMQYAHVPGDPDICPPTGGWHVPSDAEYCTLTQFIDPTVNCGVTGWSGTDVGVKMKSTSGWFLGGNGSNASGFTALGAGKRESNGSFSLLTASAYFWTSAESGSEVWKRELTYEYAYISRTLSAKEPGFSIRCVKE
jgi:uncharacterized protein (TIGR02145 family)